jgi:DNA (cytosine-5)-methyltransferase 1
LRVGSLFSGIGGLDLGLERAGMEVVWQCEQDDFCRRVLAGHWPDVPCYPDICALEGGIPAVDVLCGGFPCQDISLAGKGAGIGGARSGLWSEYARLVGELRPRYVVVENVAALLARGMGVVLGDLAALGYDAEWDCIPASAVGAPHRRDRLWIVAYPSDAESVQRPSFFGEQPNGVDAGVGAMADPNIGGPARERVRMLEEANGRRQSKDGRGGVAKPGLGGLADGFPTGLDGHWDCEPDGISRVAVKVPERVAQLKALGNSLVPQVAEWIGLRIMEHETTRG